MFMCDIERTSQKVYNLKLMINVRKRNSLEVENPHIVDYKQQELCIKIKNNNFPFD